MRQTWNANPTAMYEQAVMDAFNATVDQAEQIGVQTAPVDTGFYRSKINAVHAVKQGRRIVAQIRADALYSIWLEIGTKRMRPRHIIGQAMQQALAGLHPRLRVNFLRRV